MCAAWFFNNLPNNCNLPNNPCPSSVWCHSSLFRHVLLEMSVKSSVFKRAVQAITNDSMLYGARKAITNGRTFF